MGAALAQVQIGCAGWAIPKQHAGLFPAGASQLERYAARLKAVEINSSFYRAHLRTTYERWARTVPENFAFSVKVPKEITHRRRLANVDAEFHAFLEPLRGLGAKLGPLLIQLPPSLAFDQQTASAFFTAVRAHFDGNVVCEPRHPDWFIARAERLLADFRICRVAADPPIVPAAAGSGAWDGLAYYRLHGSPRVYHSEYGAERLERLARQLTHGEANHRPTWCIFDNTADGAAITDALSLQARLRGA